MADSTYSQSRIAKNTIFLYLRMFIIMGVTLYTSRIVLDILGVSDYGIYNVIGGIVVLLSLVSNSMTNSTQRFITFEMGQGSDESVNSVFCMSMIAHFIVCVAIILLGETVGLWYVCRVANIPAGRESAAIVIYQVSLITVVLGLVRSPYNALVIAYEKMSFYAYVSMLEAVLKLAVLGLLFFISFDKLILYSVLVLFTNVVILFFYHWFCRRKFSTSRFYFTINKDYFRRLFGYLGWNLLGASATLGSQQAGNQIVNKYVGVAVNAAYGLASQVNSALYSFVSNFQVAFTPQLVKLYSTGRKDEFVQLSRNSALLSYYLLLIITFPIFLNIDYVLGLWLKDVPEYTNIFCRLLIVYSLIDACQAPFWIGINATGNIRVYEIWLSIILLLNIPLTILAFEYGFSPVWVIAIRVILNFITAVIRCIHVKIQLKFPIKEYLTGVILRISVVTVLAVLLGMLVVKYLPFSTFGGFVLQCILLVFTLGILILTIGLRVSERKKIINLLTSRLLHKYV